jgi:diguanylate cyclase (GGDEF)-like protein
MSSSSPQSAANWLDPAVQTAEVPHLLVVDDVADNRAVLTRRFERNGFKVSEAAGGVEALRMIEAQTFDLVLLDVMMPDMEGTEVLQTIRATRPSSVLPVIMVTARTMSDDVVQSLRLGADDYVTKPVDFPVALARVKTQLARRKAEQVVHHAAEALSRSKLDLEVKIAERTRELVRINEQLKQEIRSREQSEAEIRHLAHHDALTGLANRVLFHDSIEREIARTDSDEPLAMLCIDLDGFKSVNDTLGHGAGDELLRTIGMTLKAISPVEATVARLGGDEFAVLLPRPADQSTASMIARSIVDAAARTTRIGERDINIGASVGIAMHRPGSDVEEFARQADLALYRAKSDGRGTWRIFDPEMDAASQARRQFELDLRRALVTGDFRLYFQPIVNLKTMEVTSMEALVRWEHATLGLVPPDEFVAIAEETGLIIQLGDWVMREACRQAATWPDHVRVAVNISPVQLSRGNVVSSVVSALAATGLQPDRFEIEITETALLEKTEQVLQTLGQLRQLGVRISMDDFGTGYSSLNYLRSFPFDKIKIDRSFVQDIKSDENGGAIVAAITELGVRFGLVTTAEGVETKQQLQYVLDRGCTEVQGRLFSMPVPALDVNRLIEKISMAGSPLAALRAP